MKIFFSRPLTTLKTHVCQFHSNKRFICRSRNTEDLNDNSVQFTKQEEYEDFTPDVKFSNPKMNRKEVMPDPVDAKRKLIQAEMYMIQMDTGEVPQQLSSKQWTKLLACESFIHRKGYLKSLWIKEQTKLEIARNQAEKKEIYLEKKKSTNKGPIVGKGDEKHVEYGLNNNTLFRGIYDTKMSKYYNYKLFKASMFGHTILIDCGYESDMNNEEIRKCANDLVLMWKENRKHVNPFNIYFCNLNENGYLMQRIREALLGFDKPDFPFQYTTEHYLDMYEKHELVYLTPYCKKELRFYNHSNVYIIGALMNNVARGPLSFAKAKREGLRAEKFPLRNLRGWNFGSKSLLASRSLAIVNDLKDEHKWLDIFKQHLPVLNSLPKIQEDINRPKYEIKLPQIKCVT